MAVVCGIDFSASSLRAAAFAARLAAKWETPLHLAHSVDLKEEPLLGKAQEELVAASRLALDREAGRLRSEFGAATEGHLLYGKPDETLSKLAGELNARLIVVSALGSRAAGTWQLGSSADRISQLATCPVLVARDSDSLQAWLEGRRPLKLLVAVDRTPTSEGALRFAGDLRRIGPSEATVLHLYWAADEFRRLGFSGVRSIVDPNPDVERILRREIADEVGSLPGEGNVELRIELCIGRPSDRIAAIADAMGADLVVVGSHRRNLLDRLWTGSTSRGVLHKTHASVAVVTAPHREETQPIPEIRSVLVATDFSETGDAAVAWGYSLLKTGGVVHLCHVHAPEAVRGLEPKDILGGPNTATEQAQRSADERRLKLREPDEARGRGITTHLVAVSAPKVAQGIIQAAERLGVDAVVLGTHGRGGVARAVLGSVAHEVAARCGRPVLLVHPSTER